MHILSIDVGHYSVKFISSNLDKKKIVHQHLGEVILQTYLDEHPDLSTGQGQREIVKDIILTHAFPDSRIVFQCDQQQMTTRFLSIPVKNKKKADLMLPFQLEEDIPYSLSEIHYSYRLDSQGNNYFATVDLIKQNEFTQVYESLKELNAIPSILTTESSIVENFISQQNQTGGCAILDIGHKTSKAYFFYNSKLLMSHTCFVGGHHMTEMISIIYKISADEALIYKHQNAFILNSHQYDEVDDAQREFSEQMEKTLSPLVSDFRRWLMTFKVTYGQNISQVYLIGGSSSIKNISNYLTEKFEKPVSLYEAFDQSENSKIDTNPKNKVKYALVNMAAVGFKRKSRFLNLLTGKYTQASATELPLHSFAFIGVRSLAASLIFTVALGVERFFIQKDIKFINTAITKAMKSSELGLTSRQKRVALTDPNSVFQKLVKNQRTIKQEISTLQSAIDIQALSPLVSLSQLAAATQATLIEFQVSENNDINATFISESLEDLKTLKQNLERSQLEDPQVDLDERKLTLNFKARG